VNCIAWAPRNYGQILVAGSSNGQVTYYECKDDEWSIKREYHVHQSAVNSISFGPATNPTTITSSNDKSPPLRFITASCDQKILEWTRNDDDGALVSREVGQHGDWVRDAAWAPNVGNSHELVASVSENEELKVWKKIASDKWEISWQCSLPGPGWRVNWNQSGNVLSVTAGDETYLYK